VPASSEPNWRTKNDALAVSGIQLPLFGFFLPQIRSTSQIIRHHAGEPELAGLGSLKRLNGAIKVAAGHFHRRLNDRDIEVVDERV
jgi:hypothetical protein